MVPEENTKENRSMSAVSTNLDALVQQMADRDWRRVAEAEAVLLAAGDAGFDAVLTGMRSEDCRIRRACARFMDHHGDDRCVLGLIERLLSDPVPVVRREAVHSLSCQRCKQEPLSADVVTTLLDVLRTEPNAKVRGEAVFGLSQQPPDERTLARLHELRTGDPDAAVRKLAHQALYHQDPAYRTEVAARMRDSHRRNAAEAAMQSPVQ
jgi:HEAT repeat protein